jgi:hypothetical protein
VRIVHHGEHGLFVGGRGQQAQDGGRDGEPVVPTLGRLERQRGAERVGLHRRELVAVVEHGGEQLGKAGERNVGLDLDTPGPEHAHAAVQGHLHGPGRQRGLADARLAEGQQRRAPALRRGVQLRGQRGDLVVASDEHDAATVRRFRGPLEKR